MTLTTALLYAAEAVLEDHAPHPPNGHKNMVPQDW